MSRFASVYRSFQDVQAFREEIEKLERDLPASQSLPLPLEGMEPRPLRGRRGA